MPIEKSLDLGVHRRIFNGGIDSKTWWNCNCTWDSSHSGSAEESQLQDNLRRTQPWAVPTRGSEQAGLCVFCPDWWALCLCLPSPSPRPEVRPQHVSQQRRPCPCLSWGWPLKYWAWKHRNCKVERKACVHPPPHWRRHSAGKYRWPCQFAWSSGRLSTSEEPRVAHRGRCVHSPRLHPLAECWRLWWMVLPMPWISLWYLRSHSEGPGSIQSWGAHL